MDVLDPAIRKKIDRWLTGSYDQETKSAIQSKLDNEQYDELTDAFYKELEFGTGGIRGIMGVGPNRINNSPLSTRHMEIVLSQERKARNCPL